MIGLSNLTRSLWDSAELYFPETPLIDATLLGTPIQAGVGVDNALEKKIADLDRGHDYSTLTATGSRISVLDQECLKVDSH